LKDNLGDSLDLIGNKYSMTLEHVPEQRIILGETVQLESCPSIYLFPVSEDSLTDRLAWDFDQGDFMVYTIYIDCFVQDDSPEKTLKRAIMYKRAIRHVLKKDPTLGNTDIQGSVIKSSANSNLFTGGMNLYMGCRLVYAVIAPEWDFTKLS